MEAKRGPSERLGMLDEHGHRRFIIPAEVRGYYKTWKNRVHFVLMLIFLALPWIHINGSQAVHLDLTNRQFHFFGLHLFAHNAPLFFFILGIFAIGLALVTALWGRVWCGWACPQTVFIEAIYRRIEIWTEGTYLERRKLMNGPVTFEKIRKTGLKWILFFLFSSLFAHSFIAYWSGSSELLAMMAGPPRENMTYFLLVSGMTLLLLFNFGWFREQFCLIACPYGRFQSVLMDSQSVTVMYDQKRGEPRKGMAAPGDHKGDCVACNRCVQVCPTGIDIRNGIQFECIACTACVDACDEIMTKLKKPTGLIRYKSLQDGPVKWLRPRVIGYSALVAVFTVALIVLLVLLQPVRVELLRAKNTPFITTPEGLIRNQFVLRFENLLNEEKKLKVTSNNKVHFILPQNPVTVAGHGKQEMPVFIEAAPREFRSGKLPIEVQIVEDGENGKVLAHKKGTLLGPTNTGSSL